SIFSGQKGHGDEVIENIQAHIETNYPDNVNMEQLASKFAISNRNFVRRFKKATHNTPFEYLQRVRVEAAKKSFESTSLHISEVMYDVGYNDQKAFRKVFKKYTGLSPVEYRKKYNREMAFA
ncbi:MAG: AraC family transcriptional regulator, partial [Bacteroidota bacterium]